METPAASPGIRAASVWIAGHVGPKTLKMYHTENINLYRLVNACIDQGPEAGPKVRPQAFKLGGKLSSLTGPWIWDIVGLRKKKNALMRSSMRAAQGPWLRGLVLSQHALGTGNHGPGSQAFEPTHTIIQSTSQGLKLQARGHKLEDPGTRVQAHKLGVRGASNQDK